MVDSIRLLGRIWKEDGSSSPTILYALQLELSVVRAASFPTLVPNLVQCQYSISDKPMLSLLLLSMGQAGSQGRTAQLSK